jgi:hypothetical protein
MNLLDEVHTDFDQLTRLGHIGRADELSAESGMVFDSSCNPMYFTGAFESAMVLVHLNPKLSKQLGEYPYADFEDYFVKHRYFGQEHWGSDSSYYSPFDLKQVRFLRSFDVIEFRPESEAGHLKENASMAIDQKLQLELIPYASTTFVSAGFSQKMLEPHFARILSAIVAYPRKYVIFCGAVFDNLLNQSGLVTFRQDFRFQLPTKGGQSKNEYRFSNVRFSFEEMSIHAGIARSFAIQGIPMAAYGSACSGLYDSGGIV